MAESDLIRLNVTEFIHGWKLSAGVLEDSGQCANAPVDILDRPVFYEVWDETLRDALVHFRVRTWGDLCGLTEADFIRAEGIGRSLINDLKATMASRGLRFGGKSLFDGRRNPVAKALPACGVYLIRCNDFVKIGMAGDIAKRFRSIALANPHHLELVAYKPVPLYEARAVEKELHCRFKSSRYRGEWFQISEEIKSYAEELNADIIRRHRDNVCG